MRLIDADKLIEDFKNELLKVDFEKLSDNDKLVINTSAIALRDFVKRQPTAYDIDKVVEELEELAEENRQFWNDFDDESAFGAMNAFMNAIEIVVNTHTKDCNNCANYTEYYEVDNGCYMCCKGYENNYEPKSKKDGGKNE